MRRRSTRDVVYVCTWCKRDVVTLNAKTLPEFTDYPGLPAGTLVIVCGKRCPSRPAGAPVGSRLESCEIPDGVPSSSGDLVLFEAA